MAGAKSRAIRDAEGMTEKGKTSSKKTVSSYKAKKQPKSKK